MVDEQQLRRRRVWVGLFAILCLVGAAALMGYPDREGLQGAMVRVGILLTAFWLALPSKNRPAAWKGLSSNWAIAGGIVTAIVIPRARALFPLIAVFLSLAWFAKPRGNNRDQETSRR